MNRRKFIRWSAATVAIGIATGLGVAWQVGGALVAPANRVVGPPPPDLPASPVSIDSQSGSQLAAWYVPAPGAKATAVLLHPLRGDRRKMLGRAKLLREAGYATVLVDLQAHGESLGESITCGHLERHDAAAAVQFARERNPSHRIAVIGWSLGGAAALLASPLGIDALILESVYPTIDEAVEDRVRIRLGALAPVAAPLLTWQVSPRLGVACSDLRPIDRIAQAGCPILVLAGERDEHTTLAESRRLFDAALEPKELAVFAGAAHVDLSKYDPVRYADTVLPFLRRHLATER